jgi:hypothetical protein
VSYFVTPILSLQLANPGTGQAFETTVVNADFVLIDTAIGSDRTRLASLEGGAGRSGSTDYFVADFDALVALAAPVNGDSATVADGGELMSRVGGVWKQKTPAAFATANARDTAYAKGSAAFLVQGAQVWRTDNNWLEEYSAIYNAATNLPGRVAAGWYPVTVDSQRYRYALVSGSGVANGATVDTFVVRRRPYKQRIITRVGGTLAGTAAAQMNLVQAASTGGTSIMSAFSTITGGTSPVAYSAEAVWEIAAGVGTDVTITTTEGTSTGTGTPNFILESFIQVEGEW